MGLSFGVPIPFVEHLGFELTRFDGGHSEIVYTPRPEHMNSFEVVHGAAAGNLEDLAQAFQVGKLQYNMAHLNVAAWMQDLARDKQQLSLLADAAQATGPPATGGPDFFALTDQALKPPSMLKLAPVM